ncbi:MAG: hypothetical protein ACE5GQ_02645 [Nitrospinales bacterium]
MKQFIIISSLALAMICYAQAGVEPQELTPWITQEEAGLPERQPAETTSHFQEPSGTSVPAARETFAGPLILVAKPKDGAWHKSPLSIEVVFKKNPLGAAVDINSLKVIYLKIFDIDITDRILPYVRDNKIAAPSINLPRGEHRFEIRIQDRDRMESSRVIFLRVA